MQRAEHAVDGFLILGDQDEGAAKLTAALAGVDPALVSHPVLEPPRVDDFERRADLIEDLLDGASDLDQGAAVGVDDVSVLERTVAAAD